MKGEPYPDLLEEKGGQGFPHLVFLDADGGLMAVHEGERSPVAFEETLKKAQAFLDLKKKAAAGDKDAAVQVFMTELEMGNYTLAQAQEKMKGLTLSKEQQEKANGSLATLEMKEVLKSAGNHPEPAKVLEVEKQIVEMKKAGRIPAGEDNMIATFWSLICDYADKQKDAALFEDGLNALKAKFGSNPGAKGRLDQMEEKLKELKGEKKDEKKDEGKDEKKDDK